MRGWQVKKLVEIYSIALGKKLSRNVASSWDDKKKQCLTTDN